MVAEASKKNDRGCKKNELMFIFRHSHCKCSVSRKTTRKVEHENVFFYFSFKLHRFTLFIIVVEMFLIVMTVTQMMMVHYCFLWLFFTAAIQNLRSGTSTWNIKMKSGEARTHFGPKKRSRQFEFPRSKSKDLSSKSLNSRRSSSLKKDEIFFNSLAFN